MWWFGCMLPYGWQSSIPPGGTVCPAAVPWGFWGVHVFGKGSSTTKGLRMHSFHRYWAIHTAVPSWLWLVCVLRHRCVWQLRCWLEQSCKIPLIVCCLCLLVCLGWALEDGTTEAPTSLIAYKLWGDNCCTTWVGHHAITAMEKVILEMAPLKRDQKKR